ncbi:MAG: PKD domain-containing protein [Bacteroidota bacterium]
MNTLPTLTITNPAAICAPGVIDLTAGNITTGSTAGLTYTRFTDAATTNVLANANAVTTSGTYYIKGTITATGCSAVKPVAVTINALPSLVITDPAEVCSPATVDLTSPNITTGSTPGLTYARFTNAAATTVLPNANAVAASGTYYIKGIVTATGCASVKPVTVTIGALPVVSVNTPDAVCIPGSIDLSAASIVAGSTAGLSYSYWRDIATTLPVINVAAVNTAGTYYIKGITTEGCASVKPVNLSFNAQPTVSINNPAAACTPATINLVAPAVTVGSSAGIVFTYWKDAATTNVLASPTAVAASGTYYIKGTSSLTGCSNTQPVSVTINPAPVINITNPAAVCEPVTIDITAPAVTNGSSNGLTLSYWTDAANTIPLVTPASLQTSGTYYVKGVSVSGCSASLPVTVVINPVPNGSLQTPAINYICDGTPLVLQASNAFAYQWYADQKIIPGETAANYNATKAGNYTVQFISKEGCVKEATNTIRLDLLVKPTLQFSADGLCISAPISFSNSSIISSSGGITWLWDFGDGTFSNSIAPSHQYLQTGNYTVSLTANNASCPTLTEKIATLYKIEAPLAGVRYDTVKAVNGKSFTLNARAIGVSYLWQPATGLSSVTASSPLANLSKDISYTVSITSAAGCITTDTVFVKIATEGEIYVAQGFTPNADGINDRAYPQLVGIRQLVYFKIFNRWGNLVFQTNDATPQNGWDGKYLGKMQPIGTYTWRAEAKDGKGNIIQRSGNLILIN